MNLTELKKNSIHINGPIKVRRPQYRADSKLDMTAVAIRCDGKYAVNNSVICFVDNGVFVTPYTLEAMNVIREAGLVEDSFYVPFSNWDYPVEASKKWSLLLQTARG